MDCFLVTTTTASGLLSPIRVHLQAGLQPDSAHEYVCDSSFVTLGEVNQPQRVNKVCVRFRVQYWEISGVLTRGVYLLPHVDQG